MRPPKAIYFIAFAVLSTALVWWATMPPPAPVPPKPVALPLPPPEPSPHPSDPLYPAEIRPEVAAALGLAGPSDHAARLAALRALPTDLTDDEAAAAMRLLLDPVASDRNLGSTALWQHEWVSLLIRSGHSGDPLARTLAAIATDARRPEILRDYAHQHLRRIANRASDPLLDSILATLRKAWNEEDTTLRASILLSLHQIHRQGRSTHPAIPDPEISPLVDSALSDPASPLPLRLAALRVVEERQLPGHASRLRHLASDPATPAMARASAVAILARHGSGDDRAWLATLRPSDPLTASALRLSLPPAP